MTPVFAPARTVHQTLARRFASWAKPSGFRRLCGSTCAFARPRRDGDGFVRFWVQISQWGDSWSGNRFCVNGEGRASSADAMLAGGDRLLGRLADEDLAIAEALAWHVVQRMPRPAPDHQIHAWMQLPGSDGETFRRAYERAFTHVPEQYKRGRDVWLRYFSVEDVSAWGDYLSERLPPLLDEMETLP